MNTKDKKENNIEGIGDVVALVLKSTGVTSVVEAITGEKDCKECNERRIKLNQMLPFNRRMVRCFTAQEHLEYGEFLETRKENKLNKEELAFVMHLYKELYNRAPKNKRGCSSCAMRAMARQAVSILDEAWVKYEI
tara:strand:- start:1912 stop:2319 length:408 start_codon:yes stop_codon:yes gene_type:complete